VTCVLVDLAILNGSMAVWRGQVAG
jgi:hypothetical protein